VSALDRIEALAVPVVYDRETGVRIFPDGLILLLVAVARAAERARCDLRRSTDAPSPQHAIMLSPAMAMRRSAEELEARDSRIHELRDALAAVERYVKEHLPEVPS
jgi:hypothetical protein